MPAQHTPAHHPPVHHLLALRGQPADELRRVLRRALHFRDLLAGANPDSPGTGAHSSPLSLGSGRIVANLFFEDSTRTRTSFSVAARRLGADVVDLFSQGSSVSKGETLIDTALNIEALGVAALVVRARQSGAAADIARALAHRGSSCAVINAGDGRHEHPTQGLLDALTIAEAFGRLDTLDLSGLRVVIVGDLVSSRVAGSNIPCLTALGAEVVCVGPVSLAPPELAQLGRTPGRCRVSHALDAELEGADAVMMLRIQFERHADAPGATAAPAHAAPGATAPGFGEAPRPPAPAVPSPREYRAGFALTTDRARRLKPGSIVMHPGPMNRGLEIDSDVADHDTSAGPLGPDAPSRSVILRQVALGVPVRMAVLADALAR